VDSPFYSTGTEKGGQDLRQAEPTVEPAHLQVRLFVGTKEVLHLQM